MEPANVRQPRQPDFPVYNKVLMSNSWWCLKENGGDEEAAEVRKLGSLYGGEQVTKIKD